MATSWVSDTELLLDIAHALEMDDTSGLGGRWSKIASDANQSAQAELISWLQSMGFTGDQINSWDTLPKKAAARRLGLMFALVSGAPLANYPDRMLDKLDPRKELKEKGTLMIGGVAVAPVPQASQVGGISHGTSKSSDSAARLFRRLSGDCW